MKLKMTMLPPDPCYIFKGEMLPVSCVTFKIFEQVERIYVGAQSGKVHVWDLKSKREVGIINAGDDTCLSVCTPCSEDTIITHLKSGTVSFWKEEGNQWLLKKAIKIDFFGFCKCQIFDEILYVPIKNSSCELISVKTMEKLDKIIFGGDNSGEIMAFKVGFINEKKFMIVAFEGLRLEIWDLTEVKKVSQLQLSECPMAVDYDFVVNKGLCGDPSDSILVFSLDKNLEMQKEREISLKNPGVASLRIRPDGKLVAVGCWDGKLRLYSLKSFVLLAVLDIHTSTIEDVSFGESFKDGSKAKYLLAAGSKDSRVSLWDLYN